MSVCVMLQYAILSVLRRSTYRLFPICCHVQSWFTLYPTQHWSLSDHCIFVY